MSPLRLSSALAATTLAAVTLSPAFAADPAKELPATGCATLTDAAGDAHVNNTSQIPNDSDLDIVALTLRTTSTALVAYVKVTDLQAGPSTTDGHRFTVDFTFGSHVFSASGSAYKNGTGAIRDGLAQTGQAGHTTQLGVDVPSLTAIPPVVDKGFKTSGLAVTFDKDTNYVVMSLPIADIVKYGGRAFTGKLTNIDARSTIDNYAVGTIADTTNEKNSQTTNPKAAWNVGDNRCFTVATRIALSVAKYPALRNVTAKLTTATGQALAGKNIVFYLNGKKYATLKTSSNGTATIKNIKPGYAVKAQYVGDSGYLGCAATTKI